jgi:two-component system, NtrC family, sensor kinase
MTSFRFPIRHKFVVAILVPLLAVVAVCWLIGVYVIDSRVASQAQERVRTDLNAAREVYGNELEHLRDVVRFTAANPLTADVIGSRDRALLERLLINLRRDEGLDILTVVDAAGEVLYRGANPGVYGDDLRANPIVKRSLKGETAAGTEVLPPDEIGREGGELAQRAVIRVVPTPRARPLEEPVVQSGMFLVAAAPVRDAGGTITGALYGGVLLNGNNRIVDRIRRTLFEGVQFGGENVGTATIFLGDLRIATNVLTEKGVPAIGTRLSSPVYERVLLKGEKWFDRAFVVNDWYFAAYEPIRSPEGVPIGALYVGMPEKPVSAMKREISLIFAVVLCCATLVGLAFASLLGTRLARPVRELESMARRITAGERDVRVEVPPGDEIGDLAGEFAEMTRALAAREEDIRELNRGLEQKVRERTFQLEEKNLLLVKTQEELVRAARLADTGLLAAGVAHEINNPMAIIRGNAELQQMTLAPDDPGREEADTILEQAVRIERIVGSLLKFARREQKRLGAVPLHPMLDDILKQVGHQVSLTGIELRQEYAPELAEIEGDGDQLRQVFINLVLNAIQAMPAGGTLTVRTGADGAAGSVFVEIADTGCGIPAENRKTVFTPFFTTKPDGTGLGLPVSYGIVKDHGGEIAVSSEPGQGTTFRVALPVRQVEEERSAPAYSEESKS